MSRRCAFIAVLVGIVLALPLHPQNPNDAGEGSSVFAPKGMSVTRHEVVIGGETVAYTATAGTLPLAPDETTAEAYVFFVAYTREGFDDEGMSSRPLTFAFNGGPGSSSVWLHMGALGPRKVQMTEDGLAPVRPYRLVDNEFSILDITDLVFIDPVSTGFSRAVEGESPKQFHGYEQDIESVGEFIRLYVTHFNRWDSPKFVLGESYGTIRASGLAGFLQGEALGMYLNGVVLVSAVLNSLVKDFAPGNDLPYIFFLPGYTAAAWYHKKLPPDLLNKPLPEALAEAEGFALKEYAPALLAGNTLSGDRKMEMIRRVARYAGLTPEYVAESNMRIELYRFLKELLRGEFYTVGRLDSRFKGRDADAAGERYEFDPSNAAIYGAFSTLFNHYVRTELNFRNDGIYAISGQVRPWGYGRENARTTFSNSAEILRRAMSENQSLHVFIANGYHDFATPYFATEYAVSHLGLNGEFADRIDMRYYEAGHMMYIHRPSHQKLKSDLAGFYAEACQR
jgi:carboxypeptidase C (cathepsin A)